MLCNYQMTGIFVVFLFGYRIESDCGMKFLFQLNQEPILRDYLNYKTVNKYSSLTGCSIQIHIIITFALRSSDHVSSTGPFNHGMSDLLSSHVNE